MILLINNPCIIGNKIILGNVMEINQYNNSIWSIKINYTVTSSTLVHNKSIICIMNDINVKKYTILYTIIFG